MERWSLTTSHGWTNIRPSKRWLNSLKPLFSLLLLCDVIWCEIYVRLVQAWLCPFPISQASTGLFTVGTECETEGASTVQRLFSKRYNCSVLPALFWSQHYVRCYEENYHHHSQTQYSLFHTIRDSIQPGFWVCVHLCVEACQLFSRETAADLPHAWCPVFTTPERNSRLLRYSHCR